MFLDNNLNKPIYLIKYLLERIHSELNKLNNEIVNNNIPQNQSNEEEVKQAFFQNFNQNDSSIISDLFYFTIETKSYCGFCNSIKYNFEINSFIKLSLEKINKYCFQKDNLISLNNIDDSNQVINIYDCFKYNYDTKFIKSDNKIFCNKCNKNCEVSKINLLYNLPQILVINLNRGKNSKYLNKINFYKKLDLTNYVEYKKINTKFELYAVICHNESNSIIGNFIAYCKNRIDNKWYLYNDTIVILCENQNEYLNKIPYILFYQSINERNKNIINNKSKEIINQNNIKNNNFINQNNIIIKQNNLKDDINNESIESKKENEILKDPISQLSKKLDKKKQK